MTRVLFLLIVALLLFGCDNKKEIIIVNNSAGATNNIQLPDVTGKKLSQIRIISTNGVGAKGEFDDIDWTFSRPFSQEDIKLAKLSVAFIQNITGLTYNTEYHHLYWSDDMLKSMGTNGSLLGMTVFWEFRNSGRAYIGIASEMKPQSIHDLNRVRDFGLVCAHESSHRKNLDIEEIVRAKIERPVDMNFDFYCSISVSNFYVFKLDRFTNAPYAMMIEKVAYETGIKAPWHYSRDYQGDSLRPIIQILMTPPPTNRPSNLNTN